MKTVILSFIILLISVKFVDHIICDCSKDNFIEPIEIVEPTKKITDVKKVENTKDNLPVKQTVKHAVKKQLGTNTIEKSNIGKFKITLEQNVKLKLNDNLKEEYIVETYLWAWSKATGNNIVYSSSKYHINVNNIESVKISEYNKAVQAKDKLKLIHEN